jgi:hypothetical protein
MKKLVWDPDPRIFLQEINKIFPQAVIDVRQIEPVLDDGIPSQPIFFIGDYDGLRKYISTKHWSGDVTAIYEWTARTSDNPRVGRGTITLEKAA